MLRIQQTHKNVCHNDKDNVNVMTRTELFLVNKHASKCDNNI